MSTQPFTSNEIANTMRDTVGNDDWKGIPLGVRYRLIKATRTLLADLAVRLEDEVTYEDGYSDGWDDGRLVGHYLEWGQQHAEARSHDAVAGMETYPPAPPRCPPGDLPACTREGSLCTAPKCCCTAVDDWNQIEWGAND